MLHKHNLTSNIAALVHTWCAKIVKYCISLKCMWKNFKTCNYNSSLVFFIIYTLSGNDILISNLVKHEQEISFRFCTLISVINVLFFYCINSLLLILRLGIFLNIWCVQLLWIFFLFQQGYYECIKNTILHAYFVTYNFP